MATTKPLSSAKYNNIYVTLIPHIQIIGFYYFDKSISHNSHFIPGHNRHPIVYSVSKVLLLGIQRYSIVDIMTWS